MRLNVVVAIPGNGAAITHRAEHAVWPAVLTHQREALGVIQQHQKIDQVGRSHNKSFSREQATYARFWSHTKDSQPRFLDPVLPPRDPTRALFTYSLSYINVSLLQG